MAGLQGRRFALPVSEAGTSYAFHDPKLTARRPQYRYSGLRNTLPRTASPCWRQAERHQAAAVLKQEDEALRNPE